MPAFHSFCFLDRPLLSSMFSIWGSHISVFITNQHRYPVVCAPWNPAPYYYANTYLVRLRLRSPIAVGLCSHSLPVNPPVQTQR